MTAVGASGSGGHGYSYADFRLRLDAKSRQLLEQYIRGEPVAAGSGSSAWQTKQWVGGGAGSGGAAFLEYGSMVMVGTGSTSQYCRWHSRQTSAGSSGS